MSKLIECVPNFSEGKNKVTLDAIRDAIAKVEGVTVLDVDPGADTNRTVYTFVGEPEAVIEGAFQAIKKASDLIDMSTHKGAHARIGATDVCPIVPVSNTTMDECIEYSKKLGKRVGEELGIPVYLYGYSASTAERKNLANIRKGEYEGLEEKLNDPHWKPDFGPSKYNPRTARSGATVIGARDFLIAWNVNLNTTDKKLAHEIALNIREGGRAKRDTNGNIVKNATGETVKTPGTLKSVKAVGWYIEQYNMAQISMNLENYKVTPPHIAVEECRKEAAKLGLVVTGTELVGLIPKDAMMEAGKYYLERMGKSAGFPDRFVIETAVRSLGLNEISHFNLDKKIIEYAIDKKNRRLAHLSVNAFIDELSSDSMAPGGGSVAALCGALSAGLCSMVAHLTIGKKGYESATSAMQPLAEKAQTLKRNLIDAIDEDTDAFNAIIAAGKAPSEEKEATTEQATKGAIAVPMRVLSLAVESLKLAKVVAQKGNKNCASDAGVAGLTGLAAATGAFYNVKINAPLLKDRTYADNIAAEAKKLLDDAERLAAEIKGSLSL